MRRADRLFQIIQILRRRGQLTTAQQLAAELEVSVRTVYRDVSDLMASGVPVEGEAGLGYLLRDGYLLPPLMFNTEEIEALVLGAGIVQAWADAKLGKAAADALAKIQAALPESSRRLVLETALCAPGDHQMAPIEVDMAELRAAIREKRKIEIRYVDANKAESRRVIWPLALAFYGAVWILVGWCELRQDFRAFRMDRIVSADTLAEHFTSQPGRTLEDFVRQEEVRTVASRTANAR